jgi:hypothetical protein
LFFESIPLQQSNKCENGRKNSNYVKPTERSYQITQSEFNPQPNSLRVLFGSIVSILGFAYAVAGIRQCWFLRFLLGIAFFLGGAFLAPSNGRFENIRVLPVSCKGLGSALNLSDN